MFKLAAVSWMSVSFIQGLTGSNHLGSLLDYIENHLSYGFIHLNLRESLHFRIKNANI